MSFTALYERLHTELLLHGAQYKFYIEAATVAVLFYVALTDFLTFKIRNEVVLLLLILYVLFAFVTRSRIEVVTDVILATVIFGVLLWFYTEGAVGGGDVKLVVVVCLWIGTHCALLFSVLLFMLGGLHLLAAKMGWVRTKPMAGRVGIPYAPSVAGALIGVIVLGCL
jgi:Flp pilus assembly protein protease CpaA